MKQYVFMPSSLVDMSSRLVLPEADHVALGIGDVGKGSHVFRELGRRLDDRAPGTLDLVGLSAHVIDRSLDQDEAHHLLGLTERPER